MASSVVSIVNGVDGEFSQMSVCLSSVPPHVRQELVQGACAWNPVFRSAPIVDGIVCPGNSCPRGLLARDLIWKHGLYKGPKGKSPWM